MTRRAGLYVWIAVGLTAYFLVTFIWLANTTNYNKLHPEKARQYDVNGVAIDQDTSH